MADANLEDENRSPSATNPYVDDVINNGDDHFASDDAARGRSEPTSPNRAIPSRILLSLKHPRVTLLTQVLRTGMVIAFPRPRGRRQLNALRGNTNVTKIPIFKVSLTQNLRYQTASLSPSGAPAMKTLQTTATTSSNQNSRSRQNARHRQKLISISRCVMEITICLTLLLR